MMQLIRVKNTSSSLCIFEVSQTNIVDYFKKKNKQKVLLMRNQTSILHPGQLISYQLGWLRKYLSPCIYNLCPTDTSFFGISNFKMYG